VQSVFSSRMFRTRGGALLAGIIAALLAAVLLVVYLKSYRSSVNSGKQPVPVLVAKTVIPAGTPGDLIARTGLYQVTTVRKDQLADSAIANPGSLNGQIAAHDINPGAQLTSADFTSVDANAIQYQIAGRQRAIAVPVDATHGLTGQLVAGDKVDVYVAVTVPSASTGPSGPVVKLLASKVLVLAAPGATGDSSSSSAVLRVTTQQAAQFAFAAENARVWFVLRPQVAASKTPQSLVTLPSLLAGRG
jgi:pilus assembly protein CpaB